MKKNLFMVMLILLFSFIYMGNVKAESFTADGVCHSISSSKSDTYSGCYCKSDNNDITATAQKLSDGSCVCCVSSTTAQTGTLTYGNSHANTKGTVSLSFSLSENTSSNSNEATIDSDDLASAASDAFSICNSDKNPGVMAAFKLGSWLILIIKIVIPIILIIFGMIDMAKAVVDSNDDAIKKNALAFGRRVAIGVIIFFAPTLLLNIFSFIDGWNDVKSNYSDCIDCLLDLSKCPNSISLTSNITNTDTDTDTDTTQTTSPINSNDQFYANGTYYTIPLSSVDFSCDSYYCESDNSSVSTSKHAVAQGSGCVCSAFSSTAQTATITYGQLTEETHYQTTSSTKSQLGSKKITFVASTAK